MISAVEQPVVALVVAAGSGSRLGDSSLGGRLLPKALRTLAGVPLVTRSVELLALAGISQAVVIIPRGMDAQFADAVAGVSIPVRFVAGGASRQESVRAGLGVLDALHETTPVLVHDAARPLVPTGVVRRVLSELADGAQAVVPVLPVTDSIRQLDLDGGSQMVDRGSLRAVQTPQGFTLGALRQAHAWAAQNAGAQFTDDAALCQACGYPVRLVDGDRRSMKITEPVDFLLAEQLLGAQNRLDDGESPDSLEGSA